MNLALDQLLYPPGHASSSSSSSSIVAHEVLRLRFGINIVVQPEDTYASNVNIDLGKHHKPENLVDSVAYWTVKSLRIPTDLFFRVSIDHHCTIETDH